MAKIVTNQITNAVVYINGNSMLGRAAKIDLPDLELMMADHMALGMVGEIQLPVGFKALTGSIDWNSWYQDVAVLVTNPFTGLQMQIRSNVETWDSTGRTAEAALVTFLTATFTTWPLGKFEPRKKADFPAKFSATYLRQSIGGTDIIELDYMANIFKINNVDQLQNYRSNTGA